MHTNNPNRNRHAIRVLALWFVCLAWIHTACVPNPFIEHYVDFTGGAGVKDNAMLIAPQSEPRFTWTQQFDTDARMLEEEGYVAIGRSAFDNRVPIPLGKDALNYAESEEPWLVRAAKEVSAEVVLATRDYAVMKGGWAETGGTGTALTESQRNKYFVVFWAKAKPTVLRVRLRNPSDGERLIIGSNKGATVAVVTKDSPAFNSGIIPGDVIVRIDALEAIDADQTARMLIGKRGQTVAIVVNRSGQEIEKIVQLRE